MSFTRLSGLLGAVGALLATFIAAAPAAAAAQPPLSSEYVALGDSFAAGPLILPQEQLDPCFRSTRDYAHLVAAALDAKIFRDVTCSGATTKNVLDTPQKAVLPGGKAMPPQIEAVSADTTLVTMSIGANDIGLTGVGMECLHLLPDGLSPRQSCKAAETAGGVDRGAELVDTAAVPIAATLDAVHKKAPHARIIITSYGDYVQPDGCYPLQPLWPQDANYIQGLVNRLGTVTKGVAARHHAEYVDFIGPGAGHDGCQLTQNWVNLVVPGTTLGIVPLHPTALGERNFARILVAHLAESAHRS